MIKSDAEWYWIFGGILSVLFGLLSFFLTFLGDPGIPQEIYHMKAHPYQKIER